MSSEWHGKDGGRFSWVIRGQRGVGEGQAQDTGGTGETSSAESLPKTEMPNKSFLCLHQQIVGTDVRSSP